MFGFNSNDRKDYAGWHGLPGILQNNQLMAGNLGLMGGGQQQGFGDDGGGNMNLGELLAMMNRGGSQGQGSGGGGAYLGGNGLI